MHAYAGTRNDAIARAIAGCMVSPRHGVIDIYHYEKTGTWHLRSEGLGSPGDGWTLFASVRQDQYLVSQVVVSFYGDYP